jgi:hypothetical protein
VDAAFESCWDRPVPFREILVQYAVLAILVGFAAAMMAARRQLFRGLGWMATVVLFFWAVIYTAVVPRWGISSSAVPLELWARRMSWLILGALDLALGLFAIAIFRWRSSRQVIKDGTPACG